MTLDPLRHPWSNQGKLDYQRSQELLRKVRKPIRVDDTMTMRETSGGIVLGVRRQAINGATMRWFRIITDDELVAAAVGESTNDFKCRATMDSCTEDDVPSIWGVWVEYNESTCLLDDKDTTPVLVYFPYAFALCHIFTNPIGECERNKWIGMVVQGFWSPQAGRWESDSKKIGDWDQVDFIRFCGAREALIVCGTGNCPDEETTPSELLCCIFDGIARRDLESCDYTCGADKNKQFDVWILCNDVSALPISQECFLGRRVSDAFTLTYCPNWGPVAGPDIEETRPVYSIGFCGCGCPRDELYIEFFATKTVAGPGGASQVLQVPCDTIDGRRFTIPLYPKPPDPGDDPAIIYYEGWFCMSQRIPVYLAQVADPADPFEIYVATDCITGLAVSQWASDGDIDPTLGGDCQIGVSGYSAGSAFKTGFVDVLKEYQSGGGTTGLPKVCEDHWQHCQFCYKVNVQCLDGNVSLTLELCLPPGHPVYAGTALEDPAAEPRDLIVVGDAESLDDLLIGCDGRNWYSFDPIFGRDNPLFLLPPGEVDNYYGWPQYLHHVFGGCCIDHAVLASEAATGGVPEVLCGCCVPNPFATLDDCATAGGNCNNRIYAKVSWNCLNDIVG